QGLDRLSRPPASHARVVRLTILMNLTPWLPPGLAQLATVARSRSQDTHLPPFASRTDWVSVAVWLAGVLEGKGGHRRRGQRIAIPALRRCLPADTQPST